jgi:urease accessory protein
MHATVLRVQRRLTLLLITVLVPTVALAHQGASLAYGSFLGGLLHPVLGPDHFLAMVSVGILSAQIGGRAIWTVPATFVSVMALGGVGGAAADLH